ncbi:hypothetical protein N1851_009074 [Merluccius polli]|uniref:Uncharacterized protein n=1 Tax=Merluccius polli TaxID=89951 RepID=A0AA47N0L0_MERPO|nr:hypothetical protein N1851_009074 [Merluccius polli]
MPLSTDMTEWRGVSGSHNSRASPWSWMKENCSDMEEERTHLYSSFPTISQHALLLSVLLQSRYHFLEVGLNILPHVLSMRTRFVSSDETLVTQQSTDRPEGKRIYTDPEGLGQAVAMATLGPQTRLDGVLDHAAHVVQWSQKPMGPRARGLNVSLQERAEGPREHLLVGKHKHPEKDKEEELAIKTRLVSVLDSKDAFFAAVTLLKFKMRWLREEE